MTTAMSDTGFIVDRSIAPAKSIVTQNEDMLLVNRERALVDMGGVSPRRYKIGFLQPSHQPAACVQSLLGFLKLEENWDSYGAKPIDEAHVKLALDILINILRCHTNVPPPSVVPTAGGGVQLEWHTNGIDLELETLSSQRFLVSFENANTGEEWELELDYDYSPLMQAITFLTEHS